MYFSLSHPSLPKGSYSLSLLSDSKLDANWMLTRCLPRHHLVDSLLVDTLNIKNLVTLAHFTCPFFSRLWNIAICKSTQDTFQFFKSHTENFIPLRTFSFPLSLSNKSNKKLKWLFLSLVVQLPLEWSSLGALAAANGNVIHWMHGFHTWKHLEKIGFWNEKCLGIHLLNRFYLNITIWCFQFQQAACKPQS